MTLRLQAFLDELGPNPISDAQQRVNEAVEARKTQLVRHALGDRQQWRTQLRALATNREDLEHRSPAAPDPPEGDEACSPNRENAIQRASRGRTPPPPSAQGTPATTSPPPHRR